jgi:hypothetical protein
MTSRPVWRCLAALSFKMSLGFRPCGKGGPTIAMQMGGYSIGPAVDECSLRLPRSASGPDLDLADGI